MGKIIRHILSNGMRVLLIPIKKTEIFTIGIFVKAGSRNEDEKNNGVAHYLEHMMFKDTKKRSSQKIAEQLESTGATSNAATSKEYTTYYIYGNAEDWKLFVDIIIDLYCNPLFRQKDIDKERNVILEEMSMNIDDPSYIIYQKVHEKIFKHNSLKYPILGTKKSILNMKREDFLNFRKEYYTPYNSALVITGKFDQNKVMSLVKKEFSKCSIKAELPNVSHTTVFCHAMQNKPYIYLKKANLSQTQIMIVFRSVSEVNEFTYALDLVGDILSSGSSSRLFNVLRNKLGVTYFNHSYNLGYLDDGVFIIHVGVDPKRVSEVVIAILLELKKLKKRGITKSELEKVKKIRKTSMMLSLQHPKDYLFHYGLDELFGPYKNKKHEKTHTFETTEYDDVTEKDVTETINHTFRPNNFNLFVLGNISKIKKEIGKIENVLMMLK